MLTTVMLRLHAMERIGLEDGGGSETISAEEAGLGFSSIADVVLSRLLQAVEDDIVAKHGKIKGGGCVIVGLGKLGGSEMTAGSDLEQIFLRVTGHDTPGSLV